MTNFKYLQSMSADELAQWMSSKFSEAAPWEDWWDNNYCNNCDCIILTKEEAEKKLGLQIFGQTVQCAYCEVNNGKCRYFPRVPSDKEVAKMWLEAEVEE